jgi:alkanesulfonate monooxygenase SsuD/methylene tetrahydromethanopterin reductase-like flavin-dependent oxidoreductase (luciferase family)
MPRPEFGVSIVPTWEDPGLALRLARLADENGYDLVGIQDHPYQWRYFDTWTLIAWLAAQTSRVRFFPDVANLPLRPPAVLAKAAVSLDVLSGGRFELGLGAGGFWDAIPTMGGPRRSPSEAVRATEEAIDVIRLIWSGERGRRFEGEFYRLAGVNTGPTRPPHRDLDRRVRAPDAGPHRPQGRQLGAVDVPRHDPGHALAGRPDHR